jgi:hypothetical protein
MLAGTGIGTLGHDRNLTISSSPSDVARGLAKPASAIYWTGAYIELLSFGFFLAFAIWACAKLGGGVLGQIARAAATGYATVSIGALAVMDATAYRSGKGIDVQLGTTLVTPRPRRQRDRRRGRPARTDRRVGGQPRPDDVPAVARLDRLRELRAPPR